MSQYVWTACACGLDIVSISIDEDDIRIAVQAHQATRPHTAWRVRSGLLPPVMTETEEIAAILRTKRPTRRRCPCGGNAA